MSKRIRQLIGLALAIIAYYLVHEGAHFLCAICTGVFKEINFMGIGMQIDVYADLMTNAQLGIFCLVGPIATLIAAYGLVLLTGRICRSRSKVFKACMYYITIQNPLWPLSGCQWQTDGGRCAGGNEGDGLQ